MHSSVTLLLVALALARAAIYDVGLLTNNAPSDNVCAQDHATNVMLSPDSGNCICRANNVVNWHKGNPNYQNIPTTLLWKVIDHGFCELRIPTYTQGGGVVQSMADDNALPWCQNRVWGWQDMPPFHQVAYNWGFQYADFIPPSTTNWMYTAWSSYSVADYSDLRTLGFTCMSYTDGKGKWVGPKAAAKQPIVAGVAGNSEPDYNHLKVLNDGGAPCRLADTDWCGLAGAYPEGLPAENGAPTGGNIWTDDGYSCGTTQYSQTCTWDNNDDPSSPYCNMWTHRWNYGSEAQLSWWCQNNIRGSSRAYTAVSKNDQNGNTLMNQYATNYGWKWWEFKGCTCKITASPSLPRQWTGNYFSAVSGVATMYDCTTPCLSACNNLANYCYRDTSQQMHCACSPATTETWLASSPYFGYTCEKSCSASCNGRTSQCTHGEADMSACTNCGAYPSGALSFGVYCEKNCTNQCNGNNYDVNSCVHNDLVLTGACTCKQGYFGPLCQYSAIGTCVMANLPYGGLGLDLDFYYDSGFIGCTCKAGYYGRDCGSQCSNACQSNQAAASVVCSQDNAFRPICQCSGHGDIINGVCVCVSGYFGANCESRFSSSCGSRLAMPWNLTGEDTCAYNGLPLPTVSSARGAHACPSGYYMLIQIATSYTDAYEGCYCSLLARDPRTRKCSAGTDWDRVFFRLPVDNPSEDDLSWKRRILFAYTGTIYALSALPLSVTLTGLNDLGNVYPQVCASLVAQFGYNTRFCQPYGSNITIDLWTRNSAVSGLVAAHTLANVPTIVSCWRQLLGSYPATKAMSYNEWTGQCSSYEKDLSAAGANISIVAAGSNMWTFYAARNTYDLFDYNTVNGIDRTPRYRYMQCPPGAVARPGASEPCFCSLYMPLYNTTTRRCDLGAWTRGAIKPTGSDLAQWHALISSSIANGTVIGRNVVQQLFNSGQPLPFAQNYLDGTIYDQYCIEFCTTSGMAIRQMVHGVACDCNLSPNPLAIVPARRGMASKLKWTSDGAHTVAGFAATTWWTCVGRCYNDYPTATVASFLFAAQTCTCFTGGSPGTISSTTESRDALVQFASLDHRSPPDAWLFM